MSCSQLLRDRAAQDSMNKRVRAEEIRCAVADFVAFHKGDFQEERGQGLLPSTAARSPNM